MNLTRLFFVWIALLLSTGESSRLYLYKDDPDAGAVDEYTETEGHFEESMHPRVVEFYSPHCVSHYLFL